MRVLFNASALPRRPAGAGIYTRELAAALAARDDLELVTAAPGWAEIAGDERVESPASGAFRRSLWEQAELRSVLGDVSVYHGAHMATPLRAGVPRVATVHDLTFFRLSRRYSLRHRWYYRALARTAARAERIIVPSAAVATDVVRHLGYAPERVRVISEAPRAGFRAASEGDVEAVRGRLGIEGPYLLCLGTAEPGKRAIDAIRAIALLRDMGHDTRLVLAGNPGRLSQALAREVAHLRLEDRVLFAGYVPDGELPALITGALALVYPSLYEGFGLPPLEAMACGTPVITSRAPAMDEVLAGAAIFVPLGDPANVARAAAHLATDGAYRREWIARGCEHVRRFSWERAAAETTDVYRELAG